MAHIAIVCAPNRQELRTLLPTLVEWLRARGFEPILDEEAGRYTTAAETCLRAKLPVFDPALVVVIGGDGTLLAAARIFAGTGKPILGVNLGFLGFLTEVRLTDLYSTLESWCNESHSFDERALVHAELWRHGTLKSTYTALNEVVVSKGDVARMGDFAVELDGRMAARFRADGVIVSTPTGSTAYTLAANGPIMTPNVDAMIITPVCPHLLTLRPIVVRGDAAITVRVEAVPNLAMLTVDGQQAFELYRGDEIRCRKSEHTVKLVRVNEGGFFEALRSKLSWGEL